MLKSGSFVIRIIHSFISLTRFVFLMDSYRPECSDEMSSILHSCIGEVVVLVPHNCVFPVFMNRYSQSMHSYVHNAFLGSVIRSSHMCSVPSDNHSDVFYNHWV